MKRVHTIFIFFLQKVEKDDVALSISSLARKMK